MAYDSREDVYELQLWLRRIARDSDTIPTLIPDGIYGSDTESAVRTFQSENGILPTGVVNFETWNAIKAAYLKITVEPIGLNIFPSSAYITEPGERSDIITFIQLALSALSVVYDEFDLLSISGVNDEITMGEVRSFQKINGIPETGLVDIITWNRLAQNYNIYANNGAYVS